MDKISTRFDVNTRIAILNRKLDVLAKGGGGGRVGGGGGSTGRSTGGSTGGSAGRGSTGGSSGSSGGTSSGGRTAGTPNSISNKGGSGTFNSPPPYRYSNTRSTYTNYPASYAGGYTPASRYGYYGYYNPGLLYFGIMPPFLFLGYNAAYHRYNHNNGYYYAPQLTEQGSNTQNVVINGTAFSSKNEENYRISFNISTNNQYPLVDHAFFSSSDPTSHSADFVYRLQFSHVVEFDDTNQNGFYDNSESILSISSLQNLQWQNMLVSNITVPNNSSQFYLQTSTFANATFNSSNTNFSIRLTWRSSNLQINNTAPITMQPNSLEYDVSLERFPASSRSTTRIALVQLLSTQADNPIVFDVNTTTPQNVAEQIKTNATYGISIGNNTEGRLEYKNSVNLTDITGLLSLNAQSLATTPQYNTDDWIWGSLSPANRNSKLILVTLPRQANTSNLEFSGFGFLDTDVMNALASGGYWVRPSVQSLALSVLAVLLFIC
ncbi:hypothetical protein G6F66_011146 [Rhizopus arrhizus]|nr:hypothetical protein G6F23_008740 [Rhizopus arrhizus]KAG1282424.1 hypothetical protein G6F66_011146 [Rhizopus arrhizus]